MKPQTIRRCEVVAAELLLCFDLQIYRQESDLWKSLKAMPGNMSFFHRFTALMPGVTPQRARNTGGGPEARMKTVLSMAIGLLVLARFGRVWTAVMPHGPGGSLGGTLALIEARHQKILGSVFELG